MPSTFSTNLKLTLMATGENSGTWGDETNNNLGTLIEQAIVGRATVAMADANQTVDILDGQTSSGRCLSIRCTGANSGVRTLTVPTVNKNYLITNATTGGFAITVKTSAGTGVDVGPGTTKMVYADGTNVIDAFTAVSDLTITGTLTASGATSFEDLTVTDDLTVGGQINKVNITAPATVATLTIADNKTLTANSSLTLDGTDSTVMTFPNTSGTVATLAATQTLTNKTLTAPVISTISNTGTLTLPTSTDTLVGRATTDTLTNKTLTSPTINSGAMGASSTATTQSAGDNSTKLATTAYADTAARKPQSGYVATDATGHTLSSSYSTPMTITEGIELFSHTYTAPNAATVLVAVDVATCAGQSTSQALSVFIDGATNAVATAKVQFTNVAFMGGPNRVVYSYVSDGTSTDVEIRVAGGGTIGTAVFTITEYSV